MVFALILGAVVALGAGWGSGGPKRRTTPLKAVAVFKPLAFLGLFVLATTLFIVADLYIMLAGIIVANVCIWHIRELHTRKARAAQEHTLASFLGLCAGNLRAGVPMVDSMDYALAQTTTDDQVHRALRTAARQARSGGSGQSVLIDATLPNLNRLGHIWSASERHGIPLVCLIDHMRNRITSQERHRESTQAALQGPQATAVILSVLPLAGILMGTAMGANPLAVLTGGGLGGVMLVVGVLLDATGFVITQKILSQASPT